MAWISEEGGQTIRSRTSAAFVKKKDIAPDKKTMLESTRDGLLRRIRNLEDVVQKEFDSLIAELKS